MEIALLYFSAARQLTKKDGERLQFAAGASVGEVVSALERKYAGLKDMRRQMRFSINEQFVDTATALKEGDELALIPPSSGG